MADSGGKKRKIGDDDTDMPSLPPTPSLFSSNSEPAQANLDILSGNNEMQSDLGTGQGVSGGPGIYQSFKREEDGGWSETVTFKRTYVHFIGPGTEYAGATIESNAKKQLTYSWDFGGSIVPFNFSKTAVRPVHLIKYLTRCNSYRMLGHAVHLTDLICSRDEVQADGRIVSTPQQDCIEVFKDTNGKFRPEHIVPVQSTTLFDVNSQFRRVEPLNREEGTIPRAKIHFPVEMYNSTTFEGLKDYAIRAFDPYNGIFTIDHWYSGGNYSLKHAFDSGRYPVGTFSGIDETACNLEIRKTANYILDTVYGVQANMATQTNRYPIMPPKYHFFRFAPFYTASGKANRYGQFKATYECTIQFYYSPYCGIDMFMAGSQFFKMANINDDPYMNAAADQNRFNFGVHQEDFVIPMTSYKLMPDNEQTLLDKKEQNVMSDVYDLLHVQEDPNTTQLRAEKALKEEGYKILKLKKSLGFNNEDPEKQNPMWATGNTVILGTESQKVLEELQNQGYKVTVSPAQFSDMFTGEDITESLISQNPELSHAYLDKIGLSQDEQNLFIATKLPELKPEERTAAQALHPPDIDENMIMRDSQHASYQIKSVTQPAPNEVVINLKTNDKQDEIIADTNPDKTVKKMPYLPVTVVIPESQQPVIGGYTPNEDYSALVKPKVVNMKHLNPAEAWRALGLKHKSKMPFHTKRGKKPFAGYIPWPKVSDDNGRYGEVTYVLQDNKMTTKMNIWDLEAVKALNEGKLKKKIEGWNRAQTVMRSVDNRGPLDAWIRNRKGAVESIQPTLPLQLPGVSTEPPLEGASRENPVVLGDSLDDYDLSALKRKLPEPRDPAYLTDTAWLTSSNEPPTP